MIGVASSKWTVAQLHKHATDSIRADGRGKVSSKGNGDRASRSSE